jgi:CRISPR-associated exonuclease Cas4
LLHERVHEPATEARPDAIVARGLRVRSLRLGLAGETDVVEFQRVEGQRADAIQLEGRAGWWVPFPVEYKRGRPKADAWDEVQLCAQALCLEETFGVVIASGALFYGQNRRRTQVDFDAPLRAQTEGLARRMHELYAAGVTPPAAYASKCERCSLIERCMPKMSTRRRDVARYLATALRDVEGEA